MVAALFDTNILVDYLNGIKEAKTELSLYETRAISIVSWMEVMVGASDDVADATLAFLDAFEIIHLDDVVADRAVRLRKSKRVKLPDAIVWASAVAHGMLLVSRNVKDFPADEPGVRHPYLL